ncbi:MAG: hypothetical protein KF794_01670 [Xanthobacteraceae bacterium]|nr:hypothetical protein [Xanthobacteraceae bacterium]QYK45448.1 MAG: hypothetical protein KF794_01670 [Xanthobacteraceae bacterium]HMN50828.1 hypothetical protein [Xanthobacteraceae bacterium]
MISSAIRALFAAVLLLAPAIAQAAQFSLRCDDGPYPPLLFTFDTGEHKAIYESPSQPEPLPGTIVRSYNKSFLFSVQGIGQDFTDFIWNDGTQQMQVGLRGTPFMRTFSCKEIPLRPVTGLFESLWPKR